MPSQTTTFLFDLSIFFVLRLKNVPMFPLVPAIFNALYIIKNILFQKLNFNASRV